MQEPDPAIPVLSRLLGLTPADVETMRNRLEERLRQRVNELQTQGRTEEDARRVAWHELVDSASSDPAAVSRRRPDRDGMNSLAVSAMVAWLAVLTAGMTWLLRQPSLPQLASRSRVAPVSPEALKAFMPEPTAVDSLDLLPPAFRKDAGSDLLDFTLGQLANHVRERFRILVEVDWTHLNDLGFQESDVFHIEPGLPLHLLLNRLHERDLDWYYDPAGLHITTIDRTSSQVVLRNYPVAPVLRSVSPDALIEAIQNCTGDESYGPWQDIHGTGGTIDVAAGALSVRQTDRVQREVCSLLKALEHPTAETLVDEPPENMKLRAALRNQRVTLNLHGVTLEELMPALRAQTGLPFRLDEPRLQDLGVGIDTPLNDRSIDNLPLDVALESLWGNLGLAYLVDNGAVTVTVEDDAASRLRTVVYDLSDLAPGLPPETLIDLMQNFTGDGSRAPWQDIHGKGGTLCFVNDHLLVVRQTDRGFDDIRELLAGYRAVLASGAASQRGSPSPDAAARH